MQADQSQVVWIVIVCSLLLLVVGLFSVSSINQNLKLIDVDVDETAIATAVLAGIEIPEVTIPEYDTEKIDEVWDRAYARIIRELEDSAQQEAILQFKEDNEGFKYDVDKEAYFFYEDDEVYDLVTEDVECDGDCVVEYIKEYDDREVEVINLGLDDEDGVSGDDREVELSATIRFKVYFDEDLDDWDKTEVNINSGVTSDDGVLEAEVTYSL